MQVIVPVTKLAKAILVNKFNSTEISLTKSDFEHSLFTASIDSDATKCVVSLIREATEPLTFLFPSAVKNFNPHKFRNILHSYYYQMLIHRLDELTLQRVSIQATIDNLYLRLGISEDVFPQSTLIKQYYRLRKQKEKKDIILEKKAKKEKLWEKKQKKTSRPVRTFSHEIHTQKLSKPRLSEAELGYAFDAFLQKHHSLLKNKSGLLNRRRIKAVKTYIYFAEGGFKYTYIMQKLKLPRNTVYNHIKQIRKLLASS